jgi:hypothetical protein
MPSSEIGVDLLAVDVAGHADPVLEFAHAPGAPAEDSDPLALLDLARDHDLTVADLDVDVLALAAGKLGFDDPGVLGLLDVDPGRPYLLRRPGSHHHAFEQLPERIPALDGRGGCGSGCSGHGSSSVDCSFSDVTRTGGPPVEPSGVAADPS